VRHATSSAFKRIKVGKVVKSRCYSSEPHDLSAAWAQRRPWRAFSRVFVAHVTKRSFGRDVAQFRFIGRYIGNHCCWAVAGKLIFGNTGFLERQRLGYEKRPPKRAWQRSLHLRASASGDNLRRCASKLGVSRSCHDTTFGSDARPNSKGRLA
jgi:hypothetical protein